MNYRVIVIFRADDGEHVGYFDVNDAPTRVPVSQDEVHAKRIFEQREHTHVVKFWRERGPNDLADTIKEINAKYPGRPTLAERTGNQPTRALVDASVFDGANDKD